MEILRIIGIAGLVVITVLLFFYLCSKVENVTAGLCALLMIITVSATCFLLINKENVINVNNKNVKIINISYYCPECKAYIASIDTKYCHRCGIKLDHIKSKVIGDDME